MKSAITIATVFVAGILVYVVFFHVQICVSAAAHRISFPSAVGVCPPFIETTLVEIEGKIKEIVEIAEGPELIEKALSEIGATYSWDRFQKRYGGIIRHPESNFHAITVKVFVDEERKYEKVEVNDSFTAL